METIWIETEIKLMSTLKNCAPDANQVHSGAQNFWGTFNFLGMHILPCKKEKKM